MSHFLDRDDCRLRWLVLGVLLLAVPACGLSQYEDLMRTTKQREERFRDEQKYLDEPVKMPEQKDKEGHNQPVATVFFRPPKGIAAQPEAEPRDGSLWRYPAGANGDFVLVEMAFTTDDKEFAKHVVDEYKGEENLQAPPRDPSWPFDAWEFNDAQNGYSINITKSGRTKIAIVFVFGKGRHAALRPAMDLSLQSLAADSNVAEARQRYKKKSPWRLTGKPSS